MVKLQRVAVNDGRTKQDGPSGRAGTGHRQNDPALKDQHPATVFKVITGSRFHHSLPSSRTVRHLLLEVDGKPDIFRV